VAVETRPTKLLRLDGFDVRGGKRCSRREDGVGQWHEADTIPGIGRSDSIVRWGQTVIVATGKRTDRRTVIVSDRRRPSERSAKRRLSKTHASRPTKQMCSFLRPSPTSAMGICDNSLTDAEVDRYRDIGGPLEMKCPKRVCSEPCFTAAGTYIRPVRSIESIWVKQNRSLKDR